MNYNLFFRIKKKWSIYCLQRRKREICMRNMASVYKPVWFFQTQPQVITKALHGRPYGDTRLHSRFEAQPLFCSHWGEGKSRAQDPLLILFSYVHSLLICTFLSIGRSFLTSLSWGLGQRSLSASVEASFLCGKGEENLMAHLLRLTQ